MEGISALAVASGAMACFGCIAGGGFLFTQGAWFGASRCDARVPRPFRLPPDSPDGFSISYSILADVNRADYVRYRCMAVGSKEDSLARAAVALDRDRLCLF